MNNFKPISSILKECVPDTKDPVASEPAQRRLAKSWHRYAQSATLYTYPLLFQSRRLVVFCDSSAWATLIQHRTPTMLRQMKADGFDIAWIKVKIRHIPAIRPVPAAPPKPARLSPDQARAIRDLAKTIHHRGLRESLIRLSDTAKKN